MIRQIESLAATVLIVALAAPSLSAQQADAPVSSKNGMVITTSGIASDAGASILAKGGNAVDAAVATAFALAVTHPSAGNIGGGGFMVYRPAKGDAVTYDFREKAPAKASPTMWMKDGQYSQELHHNSHMAV